MHVLYVHPAFPGQFRYVAPRLAAEHGWTSTFVTRNNPSPDLPGVQRVRYDLGCVETPGIHPCNKRFESTVAHALGVYRALKARPDIRPDLIVAHGSFGSSLFLPYLYDCPVINFFEYFYRPVGQDLGYRPEMPVTETELLRCGTDNAMTLLDLENCDRAWTPTEHQRGLMPEAYRGKVEAVHDGIDAERYRRKSQGPSSQSQTSSNGESGKGPNGRRLPDGTAVPAGTRVVTYVTRGFEMARGFDVFMAAARRIVERFPDVVFAIAGGDQIWYGNAAQCGGHRTFRERVLAAREYDPAKFRFLGVLTEDALVDLYSVSDLHVYLTVPYFTSWSPLEAMSCSCILLASDQACVREYLTHGENGLLCDFYDVDAMARLAVEVLKDPPAFRHLGEAARRTIERTYSINVTLPKIKATFEAVAAKGPRTPSVRAELLVRAGKRAAQSAPADPRPVPAVLAALAAVREPKLDAYDGSIPFPAGTRSPRPCPSLQPSPPSTGERGQASRRQSKTVMFCWELGGGLGHMMQMRPLAEDLARAGHKVYLVLRQLERAESVFGGAGVSFLQAPAWASTGSAAPHPDPAGFAPFLMDVGFGDDGELFARASAWRTLFDAFRPDLVVFDHSPTALLASRGFPAARAVIGSGFCVPPDNQDGGLWGVLRPAAAAAEPERARAAEVELLDRLNRVLANWNLPAMERLGQLYSEVDETFLTTFPELDHFRTRPADTRYWGPVLAAHAGDGAGEAPSWPGAAGGTKRVFAYLKAVPSAVDVLRALGETDCRSVAYVDGATAALRKRVESPNLHLSDNRVDVARAAAECDGAVLNGGHGVTCQMLLARKPILFVPLNLEQQMTADAVTRTGAGESAAARKGQPWQGAAKLEAMLSDHCYANAARRFADRYAAFDPSRQRAAMLRRAEELLADEPLPGDPSYVTREAELAAV